MKPKEILSQHLYGETYLGFDKNYLNKIESSIELFRRGNVNGRVVSNNSFGWQSDMLPEDGVFLNLTQSILKKIFIFCKEIDQLKFSTVTLQGFWANINYPGDINWSHNHAGDISGVYYINTHKNCGDLILESFNFNPNNKISACLRSINVKTIVPENDKLVIFDSMCFHRVLKNMSHKPRISLSFNVGLDD